MNRPNDEFVSLCNHFGIDPNELYEFICKLLDKEYFSTFKIEQK